MFLVATCLGVASAVGAHYEYFQHYPEFLKEGGTDNQAKGLGNWEEGAEQGLYSEKEVAVLKYVSAMTCSVEVDDDTFHRLSEHFSDQQIVEITSLISGYNMVSRFLVALHVQPEKSNTKDEDMTDAKDIQDPGPMPFRRCNGVS